MRKIRDYTIHTKLLFAFVGLTGATAILTAGDALFNIPYHRNYQAIFSTRQSLAATTYLIIGSNQKELAAVQYASFQRPADLQTYESLHPERYTALLAQSDQTPANAETIASLTQAFHQIALQQSKATALATAGKTTQAQILLRNEQYLAWNAYFNSLASHLSHDLDDTITALQAKNRELYLYIWLAVGLTLLIIAAISIAMAHLLSSFIVKPLVAIEKATVRLSNGEVDVRIHPSSQDEIGRLAVAFNKMAVVLDRQNRGDDLQNLTKKIESK